MGDDDDREHEVTKLLATVRSHPVRAALNRRHGLIDTHGMLQENARLLLEWIDALDNGSYGILVLQETPEGDPAREYLTELNRRWHNYVSSAKTLIDHVRVSNQSEPAEFVEQTSRKVLELAANPVVPFTQGLRNYILHKRWPNAFLQLDLMTGRVWVGCDPATLLGGFSWEPPQRVYLERLGSGRFTLRDSVTDYLSAIESFYNWFFEAHIHAHGALIRDYEEKEARLYSLAPGLFCDGE